MTVGDWLNEIVKLKLGDSQRRKPSLNNSEIATELSVSRVWIGEYIELAKRLNLLEVDEQGKTIIPKETIAASEFEKFSKEHPIMNNPKIKEWIEDMKNRKGGKGTKWLPIVQAVEIVCNTTKQKPEALLISPDTTNKICNNFALLVKEGKVISQRKRRNADPIQTIHNGVMGVRNFCGMFGITWRRGIENIMSGKILHHGLYADVKLTDEELEKADKYLVDKFGVDSDYYRLFWVGVESCSRRTALLKMSINFSEVTNKKNQKTFVMTAYESKTEHIKGGKWMKYITREKTQQAILAQKSRGKHLLYDNDIQFYKMYIDFKYELKQLYRFLGKSEKIKEQEYFFKRPVHALRHIGAHLWLRRTKYNYAFVAVIGGWHTIDELIKSYGEMPPEIVLELLDKGFHENGIQNLG